MSKQGSTKRQKAQAQLRRKRRKPVSYIAVPKPLYKRIKRLFAKRLPGQVGRPAISNRLVLDAIWFVLWTGYQWKAITREHFGMSGSTAHARFQQWQKEGIFAAMMAEMVQYYDKKRKIRWKWQAADGKNCPAPLGRRTYAELACQTQEHSHPLVQESRQLVGAASICLH